jgi:GNAT superfamily N-acetyltransferase
VDLIALCRPLICEPDLPRRWLEGRGSSTAECISCNSCIYDMIMHPGRKDPGLVTCVFKHDKEKHKEAQQWLVSWVEKNTTHRENDNTLIRPFRPEEQAAAQRLIVAGLAEHFGFLDPTANPDLDDIASTYADGTFLLAWREGELVGTGALIHEEEDVGRIVRMSVAPHLRRRGIGTLILEHLFEHARAAGYHQIVLETTATWGGVIAFYQRNGFRPIGSWDCDTHLVLDLNSLDVSDQ